VSAMDDGFVVSFSTHILIGNGDPFQPFSDANLDTSGPLPNPPRLLLGVAVSTNLLR